MNSKLTKSQKKTFTTSWQENGSTMRLVATVRHDDECGNGHNTFAITGDLYDSKVRRENGLVSGGCLHDDIAKHFPELAPLIKWHLTSTDGPMHYVANTMYLASDKDCNGQRKGEPSSYAYGIRFGNSPVTHTVKKSFYTFLQERHSTGDFNIEEIAHKDDGGYKFAPKYTFSGYADKWHECPFDSRTVAEEWQKALNSGLAVDFVQIVTGFADGKEPEIEAARRCAVWPDATPEQLQDKEALEARLPALLAEFQRDVESLGLVY